jgi:hypothetical protein
LVIDAARWSAVLLRLAYLGVTNAFAVLRLLPMSNELVQTSFRQFGTG